MAIEHEKLDKACSQLKIDIFGEDEYTFLEKYHRAISPIASALKLLEANKYTFALYLPILTGIRNKLNLLKMSGDFLFCKALIVALINGFEDRFSHLMDIYNYDGKSVPLYVAMVVNPQYKLNFLGFQKVPSHIGNKVRSMLMNAGKEMLAEDRLAEVQQSGADGSNLGCQNVIEKEKGLFLIIA